MMKALVKKMKQINNNKKLFWLFIFHLFVFLLDQTKQSTQITLNIIINDVLDRDPSSKFIISLADIFSVV